MTVEQQDVALSAMFVSLADSLKPGHDIIDTLHLLVEAATTFTSAVEAGVLLVGSDGRLYVAASSAERASDVEEAQLGVDGGPCVDAIRSGTPVEVPDIRSEAWKWPAFAMTAETRGFAAVHAVPMRLRTLTLGGVNLFSPNTGTLPDHDFAIASALAQVATISIVQHRSISGQGDVNAQLQRALDSRVVIEQAKGVVSQQRGVPIDEAFVLLRSHSRRNQTGLQEVAAQIVERRLVLE
jgi:hypothetical protein